jgi:hypothetical protein
MHSVAEAQGISISMIVAEVDPIGGFAGESVSEPLLQAGIMFSVFAYPIHIDPWMALAAAAIFIRFIFVPLLETMVNRRTGARQGAPPTWHRDDYPRRRGRGRSSH